MPRGGRRENAGKKSTWDSGRSFSETKVIRVPIEFSEQLLDLAHKLDAGEAFDLVTSSKSTCWEREGEELTPQISALQERIESLEAELESKNKSGVIQLKRETLAKLARVAETGGVTKESLVENLVNSSFFDKQAQTVLEKFMPVTKLAKRLNVDPKSIRDHRDGKLKPSLVEWTRSKDIDGIGWDYSPELQKYFPVDSSRRSQEL